MRRAAAAWAAAAGPAAPAKTPEKASIQNQTEIDLPSGEVTRLFLCGDVMTGRGIDQVLPYPGDPRLHESYVRSAEVYVEIAEEHSGLIPAPVDFSYVWGDALEELNRVSPDARIINLETAVTSSNDHWPGKGIHYRMSPRNLPLLTAAAMDCVSLANNHVLDWGYPGLEETLQALGSAGIQATGAGENLVTAREPAIILTDGPGRILVFGLGCVSSGIPPAWAATSSRAGVHLLKNLSSETARLLSDQIHRYRQEGDIVVVSIHWGGNWGYQIPSEQRDFARRLIDAGAPDVIHGHSSHHVKGIEVYQGKPILYGCGDFINDYEGISGYERYRSELALMYFAEFNSSTRQLRRLMMTPLKMNRFRLQYGSREETRWLADLLEREGARLGKSVDVSDEGRILLRW